MPEGFRFVCPIRVRYSEIDGQGIVYNSRYLEYVDVALSEYFRALGFPYQELVEQHGFDPSVVKATIEFKRTARFDESLQVWARVAAIGRTSFTMDFAITRAANDELITSIQIVYVNFAKAIQASRPVPESVRRRIEAFEGTSFSPSS
ncbi:MAG: acyl-CoA thioesterase [candidate division NC10 bacterium]|nr:acyl-CoA thioesterase [candidate division NC10 bacterium]